MIFSLTSSLALHSIAAGPALGQLDPGLRDLATASVDSTQRIAESIWPGWSAAPFDLLLIDGGSEFLTSDKQPANGGFSAYEAIIAGRAVYRRERVFPPGLLATFPATGAAPTIVIGSPDGAGISDSRWMFTIAHEHLHQFQYSAPGYYAATTALDLTGGDTSGMWMLNYPFPYDDANVAKIYTTAARRLREAYEAIGQPGFRDRVWAYVRARERLKSLLAPADYRYFAFQIWQEGIARYTEYRAALAASEGAEQPGGGVSRVDAASRAAEILENSLATLDDDQALGAQKRVAFYAYGHIEGLVLDAWSPSWKHRYLSEMLSTETYFERDIAAQP